MNSNIVSKTPLKFIEPIFIILCVLLILYVLIIIINVSMRLKRFTNSRNTKLAGERFMSFTNTDSLNTTASIPNKKTTLKQRPKKVAKFNDLELPLNKSQETDSFHFKTLLTKVKTNLKKFTLKFAELFNKTKANFKLYSIRLAKIVKLKSSTLFTATKVHSIKTFNKIRKTLNIWTKNIKAFGIKVSQSLKKKSLKFAQKIKTAGKIMAIKSKIIFVKLYHSFKLVFIIVLKNTKKFLVFWAITMKKCLFRLWKIIKAFSIIIFIRSKALIKTLIAKAKIFAKIAIVKIKCWSKKFWNIIKKSSSALFKNLKIVLKKVGKNTKLIAMKTANISKVIGVFLYQQSKIALIFMGIYSKKTALRLGKFTKIVAIKIFHQVIIVSKIILNKSRILAIKIGHFTKKNFPLVVGKFKVKLKAWYQDITTKKLDKF